MTRNTISGQSKTIRQVLADHEWVILATGPLTAAALAADLAARVGRDSLYFYDAITPIVYADSLDTSKLFRASRYSDEPGDYLNAPLDRAAYEAFVEGLLQAESSRCTHARPRSTSRAAFRSRRWRGAGRRRSRRVR